MRTKLLFSLFALGGLLLFATACGTAPTSAPTPTRASSATVAAVPATPNEPLTEVSVVMGYVPNVQFSPWYLAEKKGYFAQAGIKIKHIWGFETEGIKSVGVGQSEFALLGGDQVIQARAQGIPLVYVANYYNGFPISIFSLKEKNILTPQDLVGKKIGFSGPFGATYTGFRAMLYGAGIKESDMKMVDVGFAQVAAVNQGLVDAAAGYANNEPVQLKMQGKEINIIQVGDYSRLVGIGLVTNDKTIAAKPRVVQGVVSALVRSIQDTINKPDEALAATLQSVPEAGGNNLQSSQAVLNATIALWKSTHTGYVDPAAWAASYKFMKDAGFIKTDFEIETAYTNKFVP